MHRKYAFQCGLWPIIQIVMAGRFECLQEYSLCISSQTIVKLMSVHFEGNKADRYTEPSRIKRLPDVGMVEVYPKRSEC